MGRKVSQVLTTTFNDKYLTEQIKKLGKKESDVCKELGKARNYIANSRYKGIMSITFAKALCAIYKLDYIQLTSNEKTNELSVEEKLLNKLNDIEIKLDRIYASLY